MKAKALILLFLCSIALVPSFAREKRKVSPVSTAAAETQAYNETEGDTSRLNARMRLRPKHYENDKGYMVYVDTLTGDEWVDSTSFRSHIPKMEYPLLYSASIGVNIWDPVMRAIGQHHGGADVFAELSMHNRYKVVADVGIGTAKYTPSGMNYTYRSPAAMYFTVGADYNFLYNSDPAYQVFAGARYGFSSFNFSVDDVTLAPGYWNESVSFSVPSQHVNAGWFEISGGLRVKLWGPISAGWAIRYKQILHQSKCKYGDPWYIPGFGTEGAISGSFSFVYTFSLTHLNKPTSEAVNNAIEASDKVAEGISDTK